jgi:hypothetical protein
MKAKVKKPKTVVISVCCNHWRNGMFDSRLRAIEFPGLELAASGRVPVIQFIGEKLMRISRQNFEIIGVKDWYGNWCWNAVTMERDEAKRLFRWLARKPWFSPESGSERMWRVWEKLQKAKS